MRVKGEMEIGYTGIALLFFGEAWATYREIR
jgi:hypothetical protein